MPTGFATKLINHEPRWFTALFTIFLKKLGTVDITTFGCVLPHLRDPFLALANALELSKEKVIITEPLYRWYSPLRLIGNLLPQMVFLPEFKSCLPKDSWWTFSPRIIKHFLGVLGFEKTKVTYHFQKYFGHNRLLYTVVGQRTRSQLKTPSVAKKTNP